MPAAHFDGVSPFASLVIAKTVLTVLLGCACQEPPPGEEHAVASRHTAGVAASNSASAQAPNDTARAPVKLTLPPIAATSHESGQANRTRQLMTLLTEWFAASNATDAARLRALYADKLKFYGVGLLREAAVAKKQAIRRKYPKLQETLVGTPHIGETARGQYLIAFTKRVLVGSPKSGDGLNPTYDAYLVASVTGNALHIVEESDHTTDERLRYPNCHRLVEAILWDFVTHEHLNADTALIDRGPDQVHTSSIGEFAPRYEFDVRRFNSAGPHLEHRASVRIDPRSGQLEVWCPAYSSWDVLCGDYAAVEPHYVVMNFQSRLRQLLPRVCHAEIARSNQAPGHGVP